MVNHIRDIPRATRGMHMPDRSIAEDRATTARRTLARDAALAVALATILSICWAIKSWSDLSRLVLPDPDDIMRLVQVRDWLAGQGINDWTQYRMAPPLGSPMHWSRVNDFGIAALILTFTPIIGRHTAELVAVCAYPALLFAGHLFLAARIARRIWGPQAATIAIVLGAVAYPGTTVFAPGRIDHHALQVVLMEVAVLAAIWRPTLRAGVVTGAAVALSLVIGLETAPQLATLLGVLFLLWAIRGADESRRLGGTAIGLALTTAPFVLFLRPTLWTATLCDAFTPATSNATFLAAAALGLLAMMTPMLSGWRRRLAVGSLVGGTTLASVAFLYPVCLTGPYGQVDPFLVREFIVHIDEANSILAQASIGRALQLGGLMIVAVVAAGWVAWRAPRSWTLWAPVSAVVVVSGLITLLQVRGTYVGTPLSAPLLAGVVLAARLRRAPNGALLLIAWLGCAGMGWYAAPALAEALIARVSGDNTDYLTPTPPRAYCNTAQAWASVDRYPPGTVMASTSIAAFLTGSTRMSTVGAGYHRNNRGNMAMYRYFLSPPERSAGIARAWGVRYVAFCPGDFAEMGVARRFPKSLAAQLDRGEAPRDFQPLPLQGTRLRLYRLP